ncbi:hypothetical protein [Egbenema bharatensis]|uniref:hypothetical protein n=1 Tax=Egbenema bharatensis TaxID=3463334 RepID=UPI003A87BCBD
MQVLSHRLRSFRVTFPRRQTAQVIYVEHQLAAALDELGLARSRPTLVLTGGANHLDRRAARRLQQFFKHCLVPLAETLQLTVIDGGTDSGVMRLMGRGRSRHRATFPLVGIAPASKIHLPRTPPLPGTYPLEPHHTHFILTPGSDWGSESPWIAQTATLLANNQPSITLLINGGSVSLLDVQASLTENRPTFVLLGTGRLADEIATAIRSPHTQIRTELAAILQTGRNQIFLLDGAKTGAELLTVLSRQFVDGDAAQSAK